MQYNKLTQKNIKDIRNLIKDDDRVIYGDNINEDYSHDEL